MEFKLTIAICTFNREFFLKKCLDSFLQSKINKFPYEIIIIDNNSSDNTKEIYEYYKMQISNLTYILEEEIGLSLARNTAFKYSKSDFICYLDDDIKISDTFLERIGWLINNVEFDCIGGMYFPWYINPKPTWFKDSYVTEEKFINELGILEDDYVTGLNMTFKKASLVNIGGFPSNFGMKGDIFNYGEEDYVQNKIRLNGGTILFDPNLIVYHAVQNYKLSLKWQLLFRYRSSKTGYLIHHKESILLLLGLIMKSTIGLLIKRIPQGIYKFILESEYYFENLIFDSLKPLMTIFGKFAGFFHLIILQIKDYIKKLK